MYDDAPISDDSAPTAIFAPCGSTHRDQKENPTAILHIAKLHSRRQTKRAEGFTRHCYVCARTGDVQYLEWDKTMGRLVARLGRKPVDPREITRAAEYKLSREENTEPRRLAELIPTAPEEAAHRLADPSPGPEELAIQADAVRVLEKCLDAEAFRLLAMYYGLNGDAALTQEEIAEATGVDRTTITRRIKLALESARCVLERT